MLKKFQCTIHQFDIKNQPLLLAVSGGVDSMVMLDLFLNSHFKFAVAHCNFQLREQAMQEFELVKSVCLQHNIPFHYQKIDTKVEVEKSGESIQMVARRLRYAFFDSLCEEHGYTCIATAHHANDNLETLLLNLTKGTGIRGVIGMAEKTNQLVRPLLSFSKEQIIQYAEENEVDFLEDASNAENDYQRNFIRNEVIPLLREINPEVEQASIRSIENMKFSHHLFETELKNKKKKLIHQDGAYQVIYKKQLLSQPFAKQCLFELLTDFGFVSHQIDTLYKLLLNNDNQSSKIYSSSSNSAMIDSRQRLLIAPKELLLGGFYELSSADAVVHFQNKILSIKEANLPVEFSNNANEIYVDADQLQFPLQLRKWAAGDYFYPFGLGKKKKVSKFLINEKVDKLTKEQQYLLTSGQKIVWVVGRRLDDRFKVTEKTERVVSFVLSAKA